jgi:hypothetical protein
VSAVRDGLFTRVSEPGCVLQVQTAGDEMRKFTRTDVHWGPADGVNKEYNRIYLDGFYGNDLVPVEGAVTPQYPFHDKDMPWYIHYEGRLHRIKGTQFSNCGSFWFKSGGRRIYIS